MTGTHRDNFRVSLWVEASAIDSVTMPRHSHILRNAPAVTIGRRSRSASNKNILFDRVRNRPYRINNVLGQSWRFSCRPVHNVAPTPTERRPDRRSTRPKHGRGSVAAIVSSDGPRRVFGVFGTSASPYALCCTRYDCVRIDADVRGRRCLLLILCYSNNRFTRTTKPFGYDGPAFSIAFGSLRRLRISDSAENRPEKRRGNAYEQQQQQRKYARDTVDYHSSWRSRSVFRFRSNRRRRPEKNKQ